MHLRQGRKNVLRTRYSYRLDPPLQYDGPLTCFPRGVMRYCMLTLGVGFLLSAPIISALAVDGTPQVVDLQKGIEIQGRGQIHEAFAQPLETQPEPAQPVPKEPPPTIPEQPPEQRPEGDNVQWI